MGYEHMSNDELEEIGLRRFTVTGTDISGNEIEEFVELPYIYGDPRYYIKAEDIPVVTSIEYPQQ